MKVTPVMEATPGLETPAAPRPPCSVAALLQLSAVTQGVPIIPSAPQGQGGQWVCPCAMEPAPGPGPMLSECLQNECLPAP